MSIPYRARQAMRRFLVAILALVLFAALLLLCWLLWLNRYVVYSRDGAKLDFGISVQYAPGEKPVQPEPSPTVPVHGMEEEELPPEQIVTNELTQLNGYYVTVEALTEDFDAVEDQLLALPDGSTVMLQLKDVRSYAYYTSAIIDEKKGFDTERMDALIKTLQERDHYLIATIPSFQEYDYILDNERERVSYGLPQKGAGGSLWLDKEFTCYWMNPASDGTLTYLIQMVTEIRSLGFDEVVLADFRFPRTEKISFEGSQMEALTDTAATLVKTCSTDTFCVSFVRAAADLTLPEGRTRLYLSDVSAADADTEAAKTGLADLAAQVVFLTELSDTRYEEFSVLRPLESAH